jgi:hypothetical protein
VEVDDLKEFARRRRDLVDRLKADFWAERKRALTPLDALEIAEGLRRQAIALKPEWPSPEDRADDLHHHQELARKLAVARPRTDR